MWKTKTNLQVLFAGHFKQEQHPELLFNEIFQFSLLFKGSWSQTILAPVGKGGDEAPQAFLPQLELFEQPV